MGERRNDIDHVVPRCYGSHHVILIMTEEEAEAQKGEIISSRTQEKVEGWAPNTGQHRLQHLLLACTETWGPTGLPAVLTNWIHPSVFISPQRSSSGSESLLPAAKQVPQSSRGKVVAKSFGCAI